MGHHGRVHGVGGLDELGAKPQGGELALVDGGGGDNIQVAVRPGAGSMIGWGLVPVEQFSAEDVAWYATWQRLYISQPEGFEEERMVVDAFGLEG